MAIQMYCSVQCYITVTRGIFSKYLKESGYIFVHFFQQRGRKFIECCGIVAFIFLLTQWLYSVQCLAQ